YHDKMIRKKTNANQGNKRKSYEKPKAAVNDTKTSPKAAKVEVESSFLIRCRFHLLMFFVFCAFALLVDRVA
ncbi:peptidoglycan glycosyltransferase FtsI, partial [Vibrio parahaemolyticus]|nr:peptidoglycan glycosyltransferase FtsI [Vibrio parahaemolyticus]